MLELGDAELELLPLITRSEAELAEDACEAAPELLGVDVHGREVGREPLHALAGHRHGSHDGQRQALGQGFTRPELALLGWAGLRGAVPIVLATIAQSEGIEQSDTIFNAVFFVVLVSALLQGTTLEWVARRLGVVRVAAPAWRAPIEVGVVGLELLEYTVRGDEPPAGSFVRELGLPREALVAVIVRHGRSIPPRGSTRVEAGDQLFVLTGRAARDEV